MTSRRLIAPILSLGLSAVVVVLAMGNGCKSLGTSARPELAATSASLSPPVSCPQGFRTFTLTNQATQTVWIGQTAGAAPPPFNCTDDSDCGPNQQCNNPGCTSSADCNSGNMCDTRTGQCMVAPGTQCNGTATTVTVDLPTPLCTGAKQVAPCTGCSAGSCDTATGLCMCASGGQSACPSGTTCSSTVQECSLANGGTCYFQQVIPGENQGCSSANPTCPSGQSCDVALGLCQYPATDGGVPLDALELTTGETATLCMPSTLPTAYSSLQPEYSACTQDSQCQSNRCLQASGGAISNPPTACPEGGTCLCRSVVGWSGGIFGRLGCQADGTKCQSADCGNAPGQPCPLGKGGTNPFSSAEFTLQPNALDFYDVTIINGANVSIQMGPLGDGGFAPASPPSPYSCGNAGGTSAQGNADAGMLEACSWKFTPDTSTGLPADYSVLLRAVTLPVCTSSSDCASGTSCVNNLCQPTLTKCSTTQPYCAGNAVCSNPNNPATGYCSACQADSDCSADAGTPTCGTTFLPGIGDMTPLVQACGKSIGWWSYEDLCSMLPGYSYGPLNCSQMMTAGTVTDTLTNLFGCAGQFSSSCYNATAGNTQACCGCATFPGNKAGSFWPTTLEAGNNPAQADAGQCVNNNAVWAQSVQPWLAFLKQACPTAYTYAYDDVTSTFTCMTPGTGVVDGGAPNSVGYGIVFGDVN
ncbi:thaumatin family protein [Pyxidicoccus trucidator]|uniref:thaumatin family protein n=1 Tax=Pyxidicoccus trucidator TaxID=2709662 RepID=UPI0013D9BD5C|nr:thaumatin family protein [Pyxidicoccus trucidator]